MERQRDTGWEQIAAAEVRESKRTVPPCTGAQRRFLKREWALDGEWRQQQSQRALKERPDLVMSFEELEHLWNQRDGKVRVCPIQTIGFVDAAVEEQTRLNAVSSNEAEEDCTLLPTVERQRAERIVGQLTKQYADVFPPKLPKLGDSPGTSAAEPFRIELKPSTQPAGRYGARMTAEDTEIAGKMLRELLSDGFIRPSQSPWGSPMFLVDKPDGSKRMVIDYRVLNSSTVRNRYPLPRVDELFDQLQGARYFSKLDLRTGYWQIRVASEDVPKTAFTSRHGHYERLVLPMGLTNAPAAFMALMENTFREELDKFVLVFLDDILVYSKTLEEHEQHLRVVLERLREKKLYAKLSKCQFFRQEVEFLGHYVGRNGVRMVEGKVTAVERWPVPTCQKEVEQFIGLAGYYRRFIKDFSKIASPLSELCGTLTKSKGGASRRPPKKIFHWGEEQQQAFEALKEAVSSAPCLAMPDPKREFLLHCDASGYATGAVLMQQFEEGLRPIAFLSKKMSKAERNYPVHEQELLAILNALKAWRHYLGGRHFTVLTDHQSLQYVETSAMATPRQLRWSAWLSEFDFSIKYARGDTNVAADALSRGAAGGRAEQGKEEETEAPSPKLLISAIREWAPMPVRIKEAAVNDADYREMLQWPREKLEAANREVSGGLLYRAGGDGSGGQLVIPNSKGLRTYLLHAAHDTLMGAHHGGATTAKWLAERVWWRGMAAEAQR
jgi:hypothetical protein